MAKKNRNNLSFVGENIKKIRQSKKMSQADFSKVFSLARASIGAYEEGRSEPKIETLIAIANYFSISIDALLTRRLTVAEIYKFNRLNEKLDQVHQLKGRGVHSSKEVKLIQVSEYLNYIVQRNSKDYLSGLEKTGLPNKFSDAEIAIEMNGGEMAIENKGILHGDLLIGKSIDLTDIEACLNQVITVVGSEEIITRRLNKIEEGFLTLTADNPAYEVHMIDKGSILEAWKIIGVITTHISSPTNTEDRLHRIEEELKRLSGNK